MQRKPDHDCGNWPDSYYKNDSGWDTSYCPELPVHDIIDSTETQSLHFFKNANGDILVYDKETRERINTINKPEADALEKIL